MVSEGATQASRGGEQPTALPSSETIHHTNQHDTVNPSAVVARTRPSVVTNSSLIELNTHSTRGKPGTVLETQPAIQGQ